jgi:spoIIIJ-associated protein
MEEDASITPFAQAEESPEDEFEEQEEVSAPPASIKPEDEYILHVAEDTVAELLERMHVHADVSAKYGIADDLRNRVPVNVEITGKDLSILIGRQAETLNALQYIAGLMVSKEIGQALTLVIDVQGFRKRREQQLRQLARRMADQAIKTGRRQVLEPMPANERRIIHIELRDHPQVTTESVGEEPRRKVTILLK